MTKVAVSTNNAPAPLPFFSQAIICNGMVYCSGAIGQDASGKLIEGNIGDRTKQALRNLSAVLEAAGSDLQNTVQVRVFLTTMENFAAVNRAYDGFFRDPKPCRTCVAVKELPMRTDVEIDCVAYVSPLASVESAASSGTIT